MADSMSRVAKVPDEDGPSWQTRAAVRATRVVRKGFRSQTQRLLLAKEGTFSTPNKDHNCKGLKPMKYVEIYDSDDTKTYSNNNAS